MKLVIKKNNEKNNVKNYIKNNIVKNIIKIFFFCYIVTVVLRTNSFATSIPNKISYTDYIKTFYELQAENEQELNKKINECKEDYASRYVPYIDIDYALGRTTDASGNTIYYNGNVANANDIGGNLVVSNDIETYMQQINLYVGIKANENNGAYKNTIQYLSLMQKYGQMYGVDPYLAVAIACQESGGKHNESTFRKEAGCGLMQIEKPGSTTTSVQARNKLTGEIDTMEVTYEAMTEPDAEKNIKAGIMKLANHFDSYGGNVYLALQAYNYGSGGAKKTVNLYREGENIQSTFEEVKRDSTLLGWMGYRKLIHEDPGNYLGPEYDNGYQCKISFCPNKGNHASGSTYGDPFYVERVLSYYHKSNVS